MTGPHIDLYRDLGLDRRMPSPAIVDELARRAAQTPATDAGRQEQLSLALMILGDPGRRATYDRHLDDPAAPPITVPTLRQIAALPAAGDHAPSEPVPKAAKPSRIGVVLGELKRHKWLTGAVALLLVTLLVVITVLATTGGDSDSGQAADSNAAIERELSEQSWQPERLNEVEADLYLDPELARNSLFVRRESVAADRGPLLPNGLFRIGAGTDDFRLSLPGPQTYKIDLRRPDGDARSSWRAFTTADNGPVVIRASYVVKAGSGINRDTTSVVIETFDAVTAQRSDEKTYVFDLDDYQDADQSLRYLGHQGPVVPLAVTDGAVMAVIGSQVVRLDRASDTIEKLPADWLSGSGPVTFHTDLIYRHGDTPYLQVQTGDSSIYWVNLNARTVHRLDEQVTQRNRGDLLDFEITQSSLGVVMISPNGEVRIWSNDAGLGAPVMTLPDYGVTVRTVGTRLLVLPGANTDNDLLVLDLTNGEQVYSMPLEQYRDNRLQWMTADEEWVYVQDADGWYQIDPATGEQSDEIPISVPLGNSGGYYLRMTPRPAADGWDARDTGVFALLD